MLLLYGAVAWYNHTPCCCILRCCNAGDLSAAQLETLLDPRADQRTKQHIEVLRCLGLVESVVIPDDAADEKLVPLAPTVASRQEF